MSLAVALLLIATGGSAESAVCPGNAVECEPWEREWWADDPQIEPRPDDRRFAALYESWRLEGDPAVAWAASTSHGDIYHALKSEISPNDPSRGAITFWMRGNHTANTNLSYQWSLWNITLNCNGRMMYNASTLMTIDGDPISESDVQSPWLLIRPGTIFQSAEMKLCAG